MQSKVEDGLSKIQGGLQQGKERIRQSQELKKLSHDVQTATAKKAQLLYQMGEKLYGEIRSGTSDGSEYEKSVNQLIQQDKLICQLNEEMQKLQNANSEQTCECGSVVHEDDKFCGSCGKEVIRKREFTEDEMIACPSCDTNIPDESEYCKCCGMKLSTAAQLAT